MVLIFSEYEDASTDEVIDWLNFYRINYLRVNPTDTIAIHRHYTIGKNKNLANICVNGTNVDIEDINSIWYRRGGIQKFSTNIEPTISENIIFNEEVLRISESEYRSVSEYLVYLLSRKKGIGSYSKYSVNKLQVLDMANVVGLDIPDTIVTTSKDLLLRFKEKHTNIINKAILDGLHSPHNDKMYHTFTELVNDEFIENIGDTFLPGCFQQQLNKKYDLRTFFLDGQLFSMAIFSQKANETKIDFRKYIYHKENQTVPFILPNKVTNKLCNLMSLLNLNCGSIDLVYTEDKKFVFLEVNPVGQYGMVSMPCNYYLDQFIAKKLSYNYLNK